MQLSNLIEEYLDELKNIQNCSDSTLKNYTHYLRTFAQFLKEDASVEMITLEVIRSYSAYLKSENPLKKTTQNYFLIALRSFLRYLKGRGILSLDPELIHLSTQSRETPQTLDRESLEKLLSAPDVTSKEGIRDKAILSLIIETGLLVSEVSGLNRQDLDLEGRKIRIFSKRWSVREIDIPTQTISLLQTYLMSRKEGFYPLFIRYKGEVNPSNNGEKMRLSDRSIERMLDKYSRKLHLEIKATPQLLRHTFTTSLINSGENIEEIQKKLGHTNLESTKYYEKNVLLHSSLRSSVEE